MNSTDEAVRVAEALGAAIDELPGGFRAISIFVGAQLFLKANLETLRLRIPDTPPAVIELEKLLDLCLAECREACRYLDREHDASNPTRPAGRRRGMRGPHD